MMYAVFAIPCILVVVLLAVIFSTDIFLTNRRYNKIPWTNWLGVMLMSAVPLLNWVLVLVLIGVLISQIFYARDENA